MHVCYLQPVSVFNGGQFEKPVILQLCDSGGHPTSDGNARISVTKDSHLQVRNPRKMTQNDSK